MTITISLLVNVHHSWNQVGQIIRLQLTSLRIFSFLMQQSTVSTLQSQMSSHLMGTIFMRQLSSRGLHIIIASSFMHSLSKRHTKHSHSMWGSFPLSSVHGQNTVINGLPRVLLLTGTTASINIWKFTVLSSPNLFKKHSI